MATTTTAPQETDLPVGTWQIDPVHSSLEFQVRNMGLVTVKGFFADFEGSLEVDEDGQARAAGTVQAASVHTRSEKRDEHLRAPDFFDVEQHPEVTFRSTGVELADDGTARLDGELTIAGVTRPVAIAGTWAEPVPAAGGGLRAGLELAAVLDRRDFGFEWQMELPGGGDALAYDVTLEVSLQLIQPEA